VRPAAGLAAPNVSTAQGTVADCILAAASFHAGHAPGIPYQACRHADIAPHLSESCHAGGDGDGRHLRYACGISGSSHTPFHGARIFTHPALHNHGATKNGKFEFFRGWSPPPAVFPNDPGG
jgi:hypothetical protein